MSGGQAGFTLFNARPDIRVKQGAEARGGLLPHFCQSVCVCVCVCLWLMAKLLSSSIVCNGRDWYL